MLTQLEGHWTAHHPVRPMPCEVLVLHIRGMASKVISAMEASSLRPMPQPIAWHNFGLKGYPQHHAKIKPWNSSSKAYGYDQFMDNPTRTRMDDFKKLTWQIMAPINLRCPCEVPVRIRVLVWKHKVLWNACHQWWRVTWTSVSPQQSSEHVETMMVQCILFPLQTGGKWDVLGRTILKVQDLRCLICLVKALLAGYPARCIKAVAHGGITLFPGTSCNHQIPFIIH